MKVTIVIQNDADGDKVNTEVLVGKDYKHLTYAMVLDAIEGTNQQMQKDFSDAFQAKCLEKGYKSNDLPDYQWVELMNSIPYPQPETQAIPQQPGNNEQ